MITWTEIDPDNLPRGEVLAWNERSDSLIGYLIKSTHTPQGIYCENEHELMTNVTHYSPINKPL